MAWTSPSTVVAGQLMTAAFWNTHVRDNETLLKTNVNDDGTLNAPGLSGALPAISGAAVTTLNGSNITAGTVADARLSTNIPLKNTVNLFSTAQQFGPIQAGVLPAVDCLGAAFGAGNFGAQIRVGRNSSGGGAPGLVTATDLGGLDRNLWSDSTGVWRTGGPPNETSGDTIGTVVGAQTSTLDSKTILDDGVHPMAALRTLLRTAVVKFTYRGGQYGGTAFHGIVADWSPEFAMDPDRQHPGGRSFNPVSAFGYVIQAIKALHARLEALEARPMITDSPKDSR